MVLKFSSHLHVYIGNFLFSKYRKQFGITVFLLAPNPFLSPIKYHDVIWDARRSQLAIPFSFKMKKVKMQVKDQQNDEEKILKTQRQKAMINEESVNKNQSIQYQRFSDIFMGYKNGTLTWNKLMKLFNFVTKQLKK